MQISWLFYLRVCFILVTKYGNSEIFKCRVQTSTHFKTCLSGIIYCISSYFILPVQTHFVRPEPYDLQPCGPVSLLLLIT